MAWTTPITWNPNTTVPAATLNQQLRDNLNALSAHTHTGAAGDGARIVIPSPIVDQRIQLLFSTVNMSLASQTYHDIVVSATAATIDTSPVSWDATNKWPYVTVSFTANVSAALNVNGIIGQATTPLLPEVTYMLAQVDTDNTIRLGLADGNLNADPTNGIFFRWSGSAWYGVCRAAGVETATSTTIGSSANPRGFRISVTATNSVSFYIDEGTATIVTTNIPATTVVMTPRVGIQGLSTGARSARLGTWFGLSTKIRSS